MITNRRTGHRPGEEHARATLAAILDDRTIAIAGPAAKHGPAWKAVAVKLGATPRACDTSHDTVVMPGEWQATCPACRKTFHRYRRPMSLGGYRCRCEARSPLVFEFVGDPARRPANPSA